MNLVTFRPLSIFVVSPLGKSSKDHHLSTSYGVGVVDDFSIVGKRWTSRDPLLSQGDARHPNRWWIENQSVNNNSLFLMTWSLLGQFLSRPPSLRWLVWDQEKVGWAIIHTGGMAVRTKHGTYRYCKKYKINIYKRWANLYVQLVTWA